MSEALAHTPLHQWHKTHAAHLVDFAGWSMPVYYESIVPEHQSTRECVGLFDVSHMGRFCFAGPAAASFLDGLLTRSVTRLGPGRVRYSLVTHEAGGILDDVLVSHLTTSDESFYWLVVNASNRQKLVDWITPRVQDYDVRFTDETFRTAMMAVQGPRALEIVDQMFSDGKPGDLKYFTGAAGVLNGVPVTVSRTGYTGEDGVEFVVPTADALQIWDRIHTSAQAIGGRAAGLGARDTLRLEAAMPLYGHELDEQIDPFQAGLGFAVDLEGRTFPGRDALQQISQQPPRQVRVGLSVDGRRVPRQHYTILQEDSPVGQITSGTFSPTLQKPIAMGYVTPEVSDVGTELKIDIRGTAVPAHVVELPFYRRA